MNCARCRTTLDDGALVCAQCGAVVGMSYGKGPADTPSFTLPTTATKAFTPPRAGATRRLPERVKGILRSPRAEWQVIANEPATALDIYAGYVVPLALIGPVALAISQVVFGTPLPLVGVVKVALMTGIAAALLTFAFALLQVFVLAWGVNLLAPKFRAAPDRLNALKVVAYSLTPVWLVGILYLMPVLAFLWVFAALYAIVLAFLGLQVLMKCAPQQALAYTFATLGIAFGMWVATGAIVTAIMGFGPVMWD